VFYYDVSVFGIDRSKPYYFFFNMLYLNAARGEYMQQNPKYLLCAWALILCTIFILSPAYAQRGWNRSYPSRQNSGSRQTTQSSSSGRTSSAGQSSKPVVTNGRVVVRSTSTTTDPKKARLHLVGDVHWKKRADPQKAQPLDAVQNRNIANYVGSVAEPNRTVVLVEGYPKSEEDDKVPGMPGVRARGLENPELHRKVGEAIEKAAQDTDVYLKTRRPEDLKKARESYARVKELQHERDADNWKVIQEELAKGNIVIVREGAGHFLGLQGKEAFAFNKAKEQKIDVVTTVPQIFNIVETATLNTQDPVVAGTIIPLSNLSRAALNELMGYQKRGSIVDPTRSPLSPDLLR
jgi:hypothetical protein